MMQALVARTTNGGGEPRLSRIRGLVCSTTPLTNRSPQLPRDPPHVLDVLRAGCRGVVGLDRDESLAARLDDARSVAGGDEAGLVGVNHGLNPVAQS